MDTRRLVIAGLVAFVCGGCSAPPEPVPVPQVVSESEKPTLAELARAQTVSLCEFSALNGPHNGELVRVKGHYLQAFEASLLLDSVCDSERTWVSFSDNQRLARLSRSEALEAFNSILQEDRRLLPPGADGQSDLEVVFVGRLAGPTPSRHRFGHMGTAGSELIVHAIEHAERFHGRAELAP